MPVIPKILHFIWFSEKNPDYVNYAISNFKQANPQFKINFITGNDVCSSDNIDVKYVLNLLLTHFVNTEIDEFILKFNKRPNIPTEFNDCSKILDYKKQYITKFNTFFSDMLRIYLLYKYGGIYLDCDTFPIKPFDDTLLNHKTFIVQQTIGNGKYFNDYFFMGSAKNQLFQIYKNGMLGADFIAQSNAYPIGKKYINDKKNFFKCNIKYHQQDNNPAYIVHYYNKQWTKFCKMLILIPFFDKINITSFIVRNSDTFIPIQAGTKTEKKNSPVDNMLFAELIDDSSNNILSDKYKQVFNHSVLYWMCKNLQFFNDADFIGLCSDKSKFIRTVKKNKFDSKFIYCSVSGKNINLFCSKKIFCIFAQYYIKSVDAIIKKENYSVNDFNQLLNSIHEYA